MNFRSADQQRFSSNSTRAIAALPNTEDAEENPQVT
jgi:hypothetical protein